MSELIKASEIVVELNEKITCMLEKIQVIVFNVCENNHL